MKNLINSFKTITNPTSNDREVIYQTMNDWIEQKLIDHDEYDLIMSVLQFSQLQVRDVMIPRSKIIALHAQDTRQNLLDMIQQHQHSRYPVWNSESENQIIGIVLAKDLTVSDEQSQAVSSLVRKPVFVPESQRLDTLLRSFKITHVHMAIVVDEFGEVSGLITIEDVLEQIVGDIEDEHDELPAQDPITVVEGVTYIHGLLPIEEFNVHFNAKIDDSYFDTIAGIVAKRFGRIPVIGDKITFDGFQFVIEQADKKRIILMSVNRNTDSE